MISGFHFVSFSGFGEFIRIKLRTFQARLYFRHCTNLVQRQHNCDNLTSHAKIEATSNSYSTKPVKYRVHYFLWFLMLFSNYRWIANI